MSSLSINSITDNGSSYTIDLTLTVGGGVLGLTQSADKATGTIALGAFGDGMTPLSLVSYITSITSNSAGCTMISNLFAGFLGAEFGVACISPGCNFTCISSTVLC